MIVGNVTIFIATLTIFFPFRLTWLFTVWDYCGNWLLWADKQQRQPPPQIASYHIEDDRHKRFFQNNCGNYFILCLLVVMETMRYQTNNDVDCNGFLF